jgi:peptidoglycan/LPS O-acetylase OafA/YrhL
MASPNPLDGAALVPTRHSTGEHLTHPKYRPDIDGLRAIAVLSVVGYHAFPATDKGGFVGVDIFFVISGFLISTIIFENLEKDRFSFLEFYSRRIRRIFPALAIVLIVCLAIGALGLLTDEYAQLGSHVAGGAGFISNLLLWSEGGYFDNASGTKPLLHLWSLGIEEQFYIVWPLLMSLVWKRRFNFVVITLCILLASFALNVSTVREDPAAAFYSPLSRFWELLLGATLAYITLHRPDLAMRYGRPYAQWWSGVGMGLLALSVLILDSQSVFPGWWALLPTLGTAFVIFASPRAWINQNILSNRVLVGFGLISYPLYLWHWPILSLARVIHEPEPSRALRGVLVLAAIALAWMTYSLIERPLRFGAHGMAKTCGLITLLVGIGATGYYVYAHEGMPGYGIRAQDRGRFYQYFANLPADSWWMKFQATYRNECNFDPTVKKQYHFGKGIDKTCYTPDTIHKKILFIWGDSHAQMLNYGLKHNLPNDWQILQIASSGCTASVAIESIRSGYCRESNALAVKAMTETKPNVVIIAQRVGHDVATMKANAVALKNLGVGRVILLGPVPQWNESLPKKIVRRLWRDTPERTYDGIDHDIIAANTEVKKHFFQMDGATFVDLIDFFCDERGCMTRIGPDRKLDITTADYGHLTLLASDFLAKNLLTGVVLGDGKTQ